MCYVRVVCKRKGRREVEDEEKKKIKERERENGREESICNYGSTAITIHLRLIAICLAVRQLRDKDETVRDKRFDEVGSNKTLERSLSLSIIFSCLILSIFLSIPGAMSIKEDS